MSPTAHPAPGAVHDDELRERVRARCSPAGRAAAPAVLAATGATSAAVAPAAGPSA